MWYVPDYNPIYVWGPPVYGYYPPLLYPGIDIGFGWFPGIDLGLYFGGWGGWGWGGWGWGPNWFGGTIFINHSFFHRYGFGHFHGEPFGTSVWAHDPVHRLGVPYANREVASRFAGREGGFAGGGGVNRGAEFRGTNGLAGERGGFAAQPRSFSSRPENNSVFGGYRGGAATRMQSDHGFSSMGAGRTGSFGGGFHGGGGGGFHGGGGGRR
jgi:hypothetical protein